MFGQIKISGNNNKYTRNLIKTIGKTSGNMDIRRNSRNDLKTRQNALKTMIKDEQNYTLGTVNILQSLIKYDIDLRIDAFKVLIEILPQDFSKMNKFKIDWVEIGKSIENDQSISIDDITQLINKDPPS
ncbi:unnamed protein product [Adineta steineri]|uniref:Uncharacterized protein n=1 Tax=Adineta steineri TaxID=433720 RepID=A0A815MD26_9BILA|nr:unnamed protein product [Adineta steineri]CAF4093797.1 unnamed protein product [Adineta steineri]